MIFDATAEPSDATQRQIGACNYLVSLWIGRLKVKKDIFIIVVIYEMLNEINLVR